ncbi:MAG TPA: flagellar basal body P-ring protein FlgI [Deltaproteobacteria bacterium]|nr:flagellar basal body P-ring protein FlgI [Deltaproteobacteria bacterium]
MKRLCLVVLILILGAHNLYAVRIKDLVEIQGVRENKLTGYGLVVGLTGTGDKSGAEVTIRSLANMLRNMGIQVDPTTLKPKNVAAVMVTASLPPFARSSQKLDCTVSSLGDSSSLAGGTLISTPLFGPDGKVYAMAQGPVTVGGFAVGGVGAGIVKNIPTVAMIPSGAIVERSMDASLGPRILLLMNNPDFTTTQRLVRTINEKLGTEVAHAQDLTSVEIQVPQQYLNRIVDFVALIESVDVAPDNRARVVVNERTGTVVMGDDVRISTVAIAHGNLSIRITEEPVVSQPLPFSRGDTVILPRTGVTVDEGGKSLVVLPSGTTIADLVGALNAIGVTPRDLLVILQCIKSAGALYAELEVI